MKRFPPTEGLIKQLLPELKDYVDEKEKKEYNSFERHDGNTDKNRGVASQLSFPFKRKIKYEKQGVFQKGDVYYNMGQRQYNEIPTRPATPQSPNVTSLSQRSDGGAARPDIPGTFM